MLRSKNSEPMKVSTQNNEPSLVKKSFAQDSDVNNIVGRHIKSRMPISQLGANSGRQPIFGDFSDIDYHGMLNTVTQIDTMFGRLPARTRSRFNNRPEMLIDFINDPANLKEAIKMKLIDVPEGMMMTEEGNLVEQTDIVKEAEKASEKAEVASKEAPKPDPEANPNFKPQGGSK